jgi:hypothetical protein
VFKYDLNAPFYDGIEDFTFFHDTNKLDELFREPCPEKMLDNQWDETVCLNSTVSDAFVIGRLNVSSCYGREFVSCSFRATGTLPRDIPCEYHTAYRIEDSSYNPNPPKAPESTENPNSPRAPEHASHERYLSSVGYLCDVVYQRIFPSPSGAQGLIVVAGATATGKSKIARGLIYKYLETLVPKQNGKERRPHLVTFEDPIDKRWADDPEAARRTGIDYTPRELKKDVDSLEKATDAALRQTPRVFFVGETRNSEDWEVLLRFASSGHLGVTTSHAGSLTEAMGQLFSATNAGSPARRSEVAHRILALIHLRHAKVESGDKTENLNITIPAIWVRSPTSTKTLMADGLAALLPYRGTLSWDESPGIAGEVGCLGRTWFAEQLLSRARGDLKTKFAKEIRRVAMTWDLEGI